MAQDERAAAPEPTVPSDTGALLLAAGGLAAAFGAASCCALPLLLGSVGVGSAWLVALAWVAAPHRIALVGVSAVCLIGDTGLLVRRRYRTARCTAGKACGSPAVTVVAAAVLCLGAVLAVLGYVYA
jgi:mercuric ion transport protein